MNKPSQTIQHPAIVSVKDKEHVRLMRLKAAHRAFKMKKEMKGKTK